MAFSLRYTRAEVKALRLAKKINPPEIDEQNEELWQCWSDTSESREAGLAQSPISPSAVLAWCRLHRIPQRERRKFWRVVHELDVMQLSTPRKE